LNEPLPRQVSPLRFQTSHPAAYTTAPHICPKHLASTLLGD
jgi:hypothetical protein